jgi:hypothetical protein
MGVHHSKALETDKQGKWADFAPPEANAVDIPYHKIKTPMGRGNKPILSRTPPYGRLLASAYINPAH